ncbi:hypothetical protein BGX31_002615, partial [Mortierella sp. GBA43]
MSETPSQAFRVRLSSEVITIPTRHDPKSGQRVVRWIDIQRYFKDAQGVLNGKDAVLFLTNDDLEDLVPFRIAYHPSVVLDVLVADNTGGFTGGTEVFGHQSVALSRYIPVPNTNQFVGNDPPPRLLTGAESGMGQEEQFQQLKQQVQRQMEEILQKVNNIEQRIQQSIHHSEQQTREQLQQQIGETLKKVQQLHEWANEADRGNHLSLDQIHAGFSKNQLGILNRYILINNQVEVIFENLSSESSVPRLFIVLPMDPNREDQQEIVSSRSFRIYFLCQCDSSMKTTGSKGSLEVHLTNHPGYDIKRSKEFFDKYGQYVLAMMHMAKYGAVISGYDIPPLARSSVMARIGQDYKHIGISKSNIEEQIDTMITYLEDMELTAASNTHASPHWTSGNTDLEDMKSYLEISEGAQFPGDLYQFSTRQLVIPWDRSWVCSEHQCRRVVQHLKHYFGDGSYNDSPEKIDVKVESKDMTMQLLEAVIKFIELQWTNDKPSLTVDCGRFSLAVNVSQGHQDVIMTIKGLSDLAVDDVEFIRECDLTELMIGRTPNTEDEGRLTDILRLAKLERLRIECQADRSLAMINLVISGREEMLQDGKSTALRTLHLSDEELEKIDVDKSLEDLVTVNHIATTLTFSEGSPKFDMDTQILLRDKGPNEGDWMCDFFRQYGWSISSLNTNLKFPDYLAAFLDNSTRIHGSQLTHLVLSPLSLTTTGLDAMDRVMKRSQSLGFIALNLTWLEKEPQQQKVVPLLRRHGRRLNMIRLDGGSIESWLPQVAENFPTRSDLPVLDKLTVRCYSRQQLSAACTQWLVAMVSTPPPMPGLLSEDSHAGSPQQGTESSTVTTSLLKLRLSTTTFTRQDWATLIKAIDFSVMVDLKIQKTNFSQEQLDLLLECIAHVDAESLPLEKLDLTDTDVLANAADEAALRARIQGVAPRVTV